MNALNAYHEKVQTLLATIASTQAAAISQGAQWIADCIADDRLLNVFGTGGHSYMGAEEVFFRAGGLVPVNAMLDEGVSLGHGAIRSMAVERRANYAHAILDYYDVGPGDLLIIVNAYGVNSVTIDSALVARERGARTIGVTSVSLQRSLPADHPSRHPSKQNLCDIVDLCIDNHVPMGDAVLDIPGVTQRVASVSTFANAFVMNALVAEAVAELSRRGIDPPIWQSGNSPGGDEANRAHVEKYKYRIKKL